MNLKVQGDADVMCDIEGDNNSIFMIGVNGTQLKMDQKKVEQDFSYVIKDEKADESKNKKELSGVIEKLSITKKVESEA